MLKVYGASDDLIEFNGDIHEEFNWLLSDNDVKYLAFSDGTVLRVCYDNDGLWRLTQIYKGTLLERIDQGNVDEDKNDIAYFKEGVKWCIGGEDLAQ